jgi:fructose-specific component phosphotransferase system IIB-like protein
MKIIAEVTKNMCSVRIINGKKLEGKTVWRVNGGNAKQEPGETISEAASELNPNLTDSIESFIDEAVSLSMDLYEYE